MATAEQLISAIRTETREGAITPERLADALAAVLDEGGSGSGEVPADLTQRLDAIGKLASNASEAASGASKSAEEAMKTAQSARESAQKALDSITIPLWTGTASEYDSLAEKSSTTLYFITE